MKLLLFTYMNNLLFYVPWVLGELPVAVVFQ